VQTQGAKEMKLHKNLITQPQKDSGQQVWGIFEKEMANLQT
jgi:hypothetical protein